jgi:hypothetical protein
VQTHLREHENILKRQLIHVGAFNLSLILRALLGAGKPREWKNRQGGLEGCFCAFFLLLKCYNGSNHPLELRTFAFLNGFDTNHSIKRRWPALTKF